MPITRRSIVVVGLVVALGAIVYGGGLGLRTQSAPASPPAAIEAAARANNLGVARLEQYDYAAAVDVFQRAVTLAPDFALARINLAIALFYQNRHADAAREADAALTLLPESPQAHYLLGLTARVTNEPDKAAEAFRRVLAIDADDVGALVGLGQVLQQQRRFDEAATLFATAVRTEPFNITASYNLAVSLTRAGRGDEGQLEMARFQAMRESGQGVGFTSNYLEQGRYAEALVSTGLEPGLVTREIPPVTLRPLRLATGAMPTTGAQATNPGALSRGEAAVPTLADLDRDGDLDLIVTGSRAAIFRNDAGHHHAWDGTGLGRDLLRAAAGVVVADYDNDGAPDVVIIGSGGVSLFRQNAPGHFDDRTAPSGLGSIKAPLRTAALADIDHDGDVDLVVGGASGLALIRNNGNATFSDITAASKVGIDEAVRAIVPTDIDNRRDLDLLVATSGGDVRLLRNQRDSTFDEQGARVGLSGSAASALAVADFNKDDLPDVALAGATLDVALSRGAAPLARRTISAITGVTALQAIDYDNDGLLDLVALTPAGLRVLRFAGDTWVDVTSTVAPESAWSNITTTSGAASAIASGDIDDDGDTDVVLGHADGSVTLVTNDGGSRHPSLAVRLAGRVSNRAGVGAKVELRAGSLRQRVETVAATPSPTPADIRFGLGGRPAADVVRVIWPSGVVQAEVLEGAAGAGTLSLTELDRKPSSCPFLYTWDGERFRFITDFLGAGEMGYWIAPGVRSTPDPDEYVRIPPGALVARDGRFDLRVTNELEETLYLDRLQLVSVTHPPGSEVFANEGMRSGPQPPFTLYVVAGARSVRLALDTAGRDVSDRLARLDGQHVDGLPLLPIRGYAEPHTLTLDLEHLEAVPARASSGSGSGRLLLLLTGWTDYAFSSDNVAAAQAGLALRPPSLQVRDAAGEWRTVIDEVGVPVGRPQTVVVDLTGKFLSASREVRIVTSMRVYWDEARVAVGAVAITPDPARRVVDRDLPVGPVVVRRTDPERADLAWRGFSAERRPDGEAATRGVPTTYEYERVSSVSTWKQMLGRYTREGDVLGLVRATDDRYVVAGPGDALAVSFGASSRASGTVTHFLFAYGYSKEMDINSASPDTVAPLPFRSMTSYPCATCAPGARRSIRTAQGDLDRYHTRVVGRTLPLLEAVPEESDVQRP